jgi:hypothetical protein
MLVIQMQHTNPGLGSKKKKVNGYKYILLSDQWITCIPYINTRTKPRALFYNVIRKMIIFL